LVDHSNIRMCANLYVFLSIFAIIMQVLPQLPSTRQFVNMGGYLW